MPSATAAAPKRVAKKVYDSPEELALVHRAKRGDETAFAQLYAHHLSRVRMTIHRIVKDEDISDWLANFAMTKVFEQLRGWTIREVDGRKKRVRTRGFDEQSKFSTWITRIAINEGLMHVRKEKAQHRDAESSALDALLSPQGGSNDGSEQIDKPKLNEAILSVRDLDLEGVADRQVLQAAIARVPINFREVLVLKYWEGHSLAEIRKILRKTTGHRVTLPAVKSRLLRGRLMLKAQCERLS